MSFCQQTGESLLKKKTKTLRTQSGANWQLRSPPTPSAQSPKHPPSKHNNAPRMSGSQSIVVFVAVTQSFNYTVTAREPIPQAAGGPWVVGPWNSRLQGHWHSGAVNGTSDRSCRCLLLHVAPRQMLPGLHLFLASWQCSACASS